MARKLKDRDFIETQEGLFFCVVGYLHPPDKYTAYLKYSPAQQGRWQRGGQAYHRELAYYHAHQVGQTLDMLQADYPGYVHYCPVRNMLFSMVPHDRMQTCYRPEERLTQLVAAPGDPLEEEVAGLTEAIRDATGISLAHLGVTGSILLGIHNPGFSDIDLTVYGKDNAALLKTALAEQRIPGISSLDESFLDGWRRKTTEQHGLTGPQVNWLIARRWNYLYYDQRRYLSLHPTRSDDEIRETYGEHIYRDVGIMRIQAVISDATESIYLPAIYHVDQVKIMEGPHVQVAEICAYEGLFSQAADVGQQVEAQGKLEELDGGPLHRLVVGSSRRTGTEYLLPVGL
jgi:predicted nucleotidyltransferase